MGIQESQIISKLEKIFCSRRKVFSEHRANVCVLSKKFSLENIETTILIDIRVEEI